MKYTPQVGETKLRKLLGITEPETPKPTSLPERFSVATPELALAVAAWWREKEGKLDSNMSIQGFTKVYSKGPYTLALHDGLLSHAGGPSDAHFATLAEFLAVANGPQLPSIGTHGKPILTKDGLVVGCTTIPWADFDVITDAVAKYRKDKA